MLTWLVFMKAHHRENTGLTQVPVQVRSGERVTSTGKIVTVKPHTSSRWRRVAHELKNVPAWELQGLQANAPRLVYRNDVINEIANQPADVRHVLHRVIHDDQTLTAEHHKSAYKALQKIQHDGAKHYIAHKMLKHPTLPDHIRLAMGLRGDGAAINQEIENKMRGVAVFLKQVADNRKA